MSEKEFIKFMKANQSPSQNLDELVIAHQGNLFAQDRIIVFSKVVAIHALAGTATLAVCPQFGWNPFGANPQTMHIFMGYGMWACGLFCGSLFMVLGAFLKLVLLQKSSVSLYYRNGIKNSFMLSSLFLFMMMTAGAMTSSYNIFLGFVFALFWWLGALIAETLSFGAQRLFHQIQ